LAANETAATVKQALLDKQKELIARKNTADIEKNLSESTKNELQQRERLKELLKNSMY
jgi:2-phosphoglycerate kinase